MKAWSSLRAFLSNLHALLRPQQHDRVQAIQEELEQLRLTLEARVLERTEAFRSKARRIALVEQSSRRMASLLEKEDLLQEVVRTLREDLGYFSVALYLRDGASWRLAALSSGDDTVEVKPGQEVSLEEGRLQADVADGRPLLQQDLQVAPHPLGLPRLGRGRALLSAPLSTSGQVLGVLDVQSPLEGCFDQDDALVLHIMALRAAIALERIRLYQQEQRARRRADAMAVLARMITASLELKRVLSLALDQLRPLLPYDAAAVLLLEEDGFRLAVHNGFSDPLPPTLQDWLNEAGLQVLSPPRKVRPLVTTRVVPVGAASFPDAAAYHSWMIVPLLSRGGSLGIVALASRHPGAYREEDLTTAEDFARQLSPAIETARLYERIRRERDRLGTLYQVAWQLNRDVELDDLLFHILTLARESVEGVAGSLILLDEEGRPTHSILSRLQPTADILVQTVLKQGAAGWVVRHHRGLLIHDTHQDMRWLSLQDDPWGSRSAALVPLISRERVIGVLTVVHSQPGHFNQDDLDLLNSIAGQASAAVQRAGLFATIREERARLEAVLEGTAEAVIVLDQAGQVLHLNRSAADLLRLEMTAALGRSLEQVLEGTPLAPFVQRWSPPYRPSRVEVPLDRERTFYALLTPIPEVGAVVTMQDISYLKALDRMKSDFVATVSHDLRTPLGAIQGLAEMLEMAGPLNEEQQSFVERIIRTTEGLTALVEDLLDLAKIEAGVGMEMAPCQIAAVIAEVVDQMAGPAALKGVSLQVHVPEALPLIWGNGQRLGQVVRNLLDNAIKYAPVGSPVTLRAWHKDGVLSVGVSDCGPGIPAGDLPHIFEKFYHKRNEANPFGTGLGLSIARSIVAFHGGQIGVESREGEGATFSFSLPCRRGQASPAD